MKCKKTYRDMDKYRKYRNAYKRRYRAGRDYSDGRRARWTENEIRIVMEHRMPNTEIARMLGRSVQAIQIKRCKENKEKRI